MAAATTTQDSVIPIQCKGRISFWDESDIEEIQTGPFPVGTRIRVTSLTNDPMGIAGKVGAIAWIIPGGASVKLDDREEKVKVQDACMTRELGISMKVVDANGEELQIRGGIDAFEPDKFREVINIQMSCKRNESPSELQEQCRNLLTKWTELVPKAGVKNNPTCTVSVDHLELDGQSLSSRDPFKWASNDSQLAVIGTFTIGPPNAAYKTKAYGDSNSSACCSLQ